MLRLHDKVFVIDWDKHYSVITRWNMHGGTCWYHVANANDSTIQYRVGVALWNGELQYYYGQPEVLNRVKVDYP